MPRQALARAHAARFFWSPIDCPLPSVDHVLGHPHAAAIEPKFDGWRCQVRAGAGRLWSRHGTDLSASFADIAQASRALPDCVLDGELVAVQDSGELAFVSCRTDGPSPRSSIQRRMHRRICSSRAVRCSG
ncbi:ATP-dependent DNA ligase, partial [Streptomyces mirabilis]|uniref:ATP-dependent DNA ligase n=1 Tax=Streptomyces mirabilis TaxID=68239 RepID=UPI003F751E81